MSPRVDRIFRGPYHASQIVDYATRCPLAFKYQHVEGVPESNRHAKALLGDVVHYCLERFHLDPDARLSMRQREFVVGSIRDTWNALVEKGNPRYPQRASLPVYYGRVKENGGSRRMERAEFENAWMDKAIQWVSEYAAQSFNQDVRGAVETVSVEVSYRMTIGDYVLMGRFDQLRLHHSMASLPESLLDQEGLRPGTIEELKRRLATGPLLEVSDWKSGKDRPIFQSQRDPWVVMSKEYQPRMYSLACQEADLGDIEFILDDDGKWVETFVKVGPQLKRAADFYTWHWLPGYQRREKGERREQYKGARFSAKNPEPSNLYLPGKAPGDYMLRDPRISVLFRPQDIEATEKDIRRVIAAMRMGVYFRAPHKNNCTCCKFTRECEQDLDLPILDSKMVDVDDYEEDGDFYVS